MRAPLQVYIQKILKVGVWLCNVQAYWDEVERTDARAEDAVFGGPDQHFAKRHVHVVRHVQMSDNPDSVCEDAMLVWLYPDEY